MAFASTPRNSTARLDPRLHTFVLVHGGMYGGWGYRCLAEVLRSRGHVVFTPTLTGYGDRSHLGTSFPIETFVADVANVLVYEDLHDVVLVGHSQAGILLPLVAKAVTERLAAIVWLAGVVLADGERRIDEDAADMSVATRAARAERDRGAPIERVRELFLDSVLHDGTPEQRAWVLERLGASSDAIRSEPSRLSEFLALGLPTGYVHATDDRSLSLDLQRRFVGRLPGCQAVEVDAGHSLMITAPEATSVALERLATNLKTTS
jgi:pimeloyl-ACP methyl ester carboxylesterase